MCVYACVCVCMCVVCVCVCVCVEMSNIRNKMEWSLDMKGDCVHKS